MSHTPHSPHLQARPQLVKQMVSVHNSQALATGGLNATGATPLMYHGFLKCWRGLFSSQRAKLSERVEHLNGGLSKLREATAEVDKLSKTANEQRAMLTVKQEEADRAMENIQKAMEAAVSNRSEVETLQKKLATEEVKMADRKKQVEKELAEVQPVLEAARAAVGGIKSDNLNEIKSLKMPPEPIRDVLEGVLRIMGNFDTSWISMKRFLGNRSVKDEIINFDSRNITPEIHDSVSELLAQKANSFEHNTIYRVSVAAAPLAAWVKANLEYAVVLKKVGPMMQENAALEAELNSSKERLAQCQRELSGLDAKVAELKADFQKRTAEAETLKVSLAKAEAVLGSAQTLLEKLSGERGRWEEMAAEYNEEMRSIAGSALLAAAFITYLADESEATRAARMDEWSGMLRTAGLLGVPKGDPLAKGGGFSVTRFLSSEGELLKWKAQGLPADKLSAENAIVILHAPRERTPLIIDPSSQATEWLKAKLAAGGGAIEVLTPHEGRFVNGLELGVRFGKTLLIGEVDQVDPILVPLLRRDLTRQGPRWVVQVGDKAIDYADTFRLFLATRNPAPATPPDVASLITVVNFSVTESGLEGQLLGITIQHEQPELEQQKSTLLAAEDELKIQLEAMEQQLLLELSNSEGNILENKKLIDSLNELKTKSQSIKEKLSESAELQQSLDAQREVYRPVARVGSKLFFTLLDLLRINTMYRFSLPMLLSLFRKALAAPELQQAQAAQRTRSLGPLLERLVFGHVSRSLFKKDRLTYAMHLVHLLRPELFGEGEWAVFSGQVLASSAGGAGGAPSWVAEDRASMVGQLVAALPAVAQSLDLHNGNKWGKWAATERCEAEWPSGLPQDVTAFQKILLVHAARPERLQSALVEFVTATLGIPSLSPSSSSLGQIHENDSSAAQPILMITTPGADPTQELEDYANRVMAGKFKQLAMGGQTTHAAVTMLHEAARSGAWLCLKNLHLVVHWVPTLEKELSSITPHPEFRLWLTTEPHPTFPNILLQQSLKITFEAPPGLQQNLARTYESLMHREYIEKGPPARAQLLFVLSWFHAVLQERRTYIPQGWTKFYEFSPADLRSAADICDFAAGVAQGQPDWTTIHGLLMSAIYGGRVDNVQDERLLGCYLQQYFASATLNPGRAGGGAARLPARLPTSANHADYVALIAGLPTQDKPDLFGLPANSDRAVQRRAAADVEANLRALGQGAEAAAGFDREKWSASLSPLLTLWQRLASTVEKVRSAAAPAAGGGSGGAAADPVDAFVALELGKAKGLLRIVDDSLAAIGRVVRGTELLGAETKAQGNALIKGEVPASWAKRWEGPERPDVWMRAAVRRIGAALEWHAAAGSGTLLQRPLRLADLLHPAFFLTALRQQTARRARAPMDSLRLAAALDAGALPRGAALHVQLDGLLLQGASCAPPHGLEPIAADAPTFSPMPQLYLAWVAGGEAAPMYSADKSTLLPLYLDPEREALLAELRLPCTGTESQWLQAGAALFLSSDA